MKKLYLVVFAFLSVGASAGTPYITEVYDYCPAPGQFVNVYPSYEAGNTAADMTAKVREYIAGTAGNFVSLGSFGGYLTFGFDHSVANVAGENDFTVLGNSFFTDRALNPYGGNCEPGVIMVSRDDNGNGIPDDKWYEIAGSMHGDSQTVHGYSITYTRPSAGHVPEVADASGAYDDDHYIAWTDNAGKSGYIPHLVVNANDYYPQWLSAGSISFSGTLLPCNAVSEGNRIKEWILYAFDYGYADNVPNDDPRAAINIDWAVDESGNPANLTHIDFVRVYTGQLQQCGALGETSTEISGAVDLHPDANGVSDATADCEIRVLCVADHLRILGLNEGQQINVCNLSGIRVYSACADGPVTDLNVATLTHGVYLVSTPGRVFKISI